MNIIPGDRSGGPVLARWNAALAAAAATAAESAALAEEATEVLTVEAAEVREAAEVVLQSNIALEIAELDRAAEDAVAGDDD